MREFTPPFDELRGRSNRCRNGIQDLLQVRYARPPLVGESRSSIIDTKLTVTQSLRNNGVKYSSIIAVENAADSGVYNFQTIHFANADTLNRQCYHNRNKFVFSVILCIEMSSPILVWFESSSSTIGVRIYSRKPSSQSLTDPDLLAIHIVSSATDRSGARIVLTAANPPEVVVITSVNYLTVFTSAIR